MTVSELITVLEEAKEELTINSIARAIAEAFSEEEKNLLIERLSIIFSV